jgi:SsrA-binding protein
MGSTVARNKKAYYDYEILDKYEAGVVLLGSEVKAIREARVNLKDSYVRIIKGEPFLLNAHITYSDTTNPHFKPEQRRARKLLLKRKEIDRLCAKASQKSLAIVPLSIYFSSKNFIKVSIALARGKSEYDKRDTIRKKDAKRESQRAIKEFNQR